MSFRVITGTDPSHPTGITQHSSYSTRIYGLIAEGITTSCPRLLAPNKKDGYLKPDVDVIGAIAFGF